MQLRRFLGGLAVLAVTALAPGWASAMSVVSCNSLDMTVMRAGKYSLIVSGEVTRAEKINTGKFPATRYYITGKVLKGDEDYPESDQVRNDIHVDIFGQEPGPIIKGMLRPEVGSKGLHVFYGKGPGSNLRSYVCNTEGFTRYVVKDGKALAISPYGKGLVIADKAIAAKFMAANPAAGKLLRAGPVLPVEGEAEEGAAVGNGEEGLTPEVVESAVKVILQGANKGVSP